MNKKRGLGKGLEALIPEMKTFTIEEELKQEEKILLININKIYPNIHQPRKDFDIDSINELAESIKAHGIIQPIIVTKRDDGYMIIAGERRWRAAKSIQLTEMPCIVREYEEGQLVKVALIENIQRQDLNSIEEAFAYKQIIDEYSVTQEKLADALGKSRPYIANTLRLLQLDERIIDMIKKGVLSSGHGRTLLRIENKDKQFILANRILTEGLNVRKTEELVAKESTPVKIKRKKEKKNYILTDIEDNLKNFFGTKVSILQGKKKGKIEIEYYNDDDLQRILDLLNKS
ncbi:ParB/RepB/Spo0J family partition protein [Alkaliphilus peptidifermentans]|uniref:Chromosome segregation DNA-binding protein n=1 Tax=Alkaliphilus peptidifermentans DSM 18978 TaxID=1120976 RepID=A0A1G5HI58_9FIRM|nr:ParB/RepB/Spo0J family partition protein [Alkaliphilus peptidifermentans]SCY62708.1 chromosome segregation DNA-binding protein [Alkaliphilus peptidifermentans DSM 18978]